MPLENNVIALANLLKKTSLLKQTGTCTRHVGHQWARYGKPEMSVSQNTLLA
jgi:hypothetical protein